MSTPLPEAPGTSLHVAGRRDALSQRGSARDPIGAVAAASSPRVTGSFTACGRRAIGLFPLLAAAALHGCDVAVLSMGVDLDGETAVSWCAGDGGLPPRESDAAAGCYNATESFASVRSQVADPYPPGVEALLVFPPNLTLWGPPFKIAGLPIVPTMSETPPALPLVAAAVPQDSCRATRGCGKEVARVSWQWYPEPALIALGLFPWSAVMTSRCDVLSRPACNDLNAEFAERRAAAYRAAHYLRAVGANGAVGWVPAFDEEGHPAACMETRCQLHLGREIVKACVAINSWERDTDRDRAGDSCDNCRERANPNQTDRDNDAVGDLCDNCPDNTNPGQEDRDGDRIGDACELRNDDDLGEDDAAPPEPLAFELATVGEIVRAGCGHYQWLAAFRFPGASVEDIGSGTIIQHVTIEHCWGACDDAPDWCAPYECPVIECGPGWSQLPNGLLGPGLSDYYESFRVVNGVVQGMPDRWSIIDRQNHFGNGRETGEARYYRDFHVDDDDSVDWQRGNAFGAPTPSTDQRPPIWDEEPDARPILREVSTDWNCCVAPPIDLVVGLGEWN